jgi:RNA polymerase sigma-70 factor (ECF subfamily)
MTDDRLTEAYQEGRARWPAVSGLTLERFRSFTDSVSIEPEALAQHAADIFLAAAATGMDADAVAVIEQDLMSQLPRWLARLHLPQNVVDDVRQELRAKVLVGPPPKLAQYRGSGPLSAWLRVAAVRAALDTCAGESVVSEGQQDFHGSLMTALDPEERLVRDRYGPLFEAAMREAITQLPRRDRNLLRFHYLTGMSYDAIARTYHVHRATVVRWLAAIRESLEDEVRMRLWRELGTSPSEFRSLWNVVMSQLDASVSRLLGAGR